MSVFNEIEKELQSKKELQINKTFSQIPLIDIKYEQFEKLIIKTAEIQMLKYDLKAIFDPNKYNAKDIMKQLHLYITKNKAFSGMNEKGELLNEGNLFKGILIQGDIGNGKSTIMTAFVNFINIYIAKSNHSVYKRIKTVNAFKVKDFFKTASPNEIEEYPLYLDDMGKESIDVKDYGNVIIPVPDLLYLRHINGAITFATTNYDNNTLNEFYGKTITDRMKQIFNVLTIIGDSLR